MPTVRGHQKGVSEGGADHAVIGYEAILPIFSPKKAKQFATFLEHPASTLSPDSFTTALGVDPTTPKGKVERFESADMVLLTFVEQHAQFGLFDRAQTLVALMQAQLSSLKVIVLGEDNHPDLDSNHPVYVLGIGQSGDLAGFKSVVIWT